MAAAALQRGGRAARDRDRAGGTAGAGGGRSSGR
eukprot:CAMPEP_0114050070 /NCGR_PEP_ID=MMETSP1339-20121228/61758_1 /TAXON_ID=94617 /ORGANISM="Fibrocapsa japonica" /LENGTH=33 /assembly_acc=CAM_ASM_000762